MYGACPAGHWLCGSSVLSHVELPHISLSWLCLQRPLLSGQIHSYNPIEHRVLLAMPATSSWKMGPAYTCGMVCNLLSVTCRLGHGHCQWVMLTICSPAQRQKLCLMMRFSVCWLCCHQTCLVDLPLNSILTTAEWLWTHWWPLEYLVWEHLQQVDCHVKALSHLQYQTSWC